MNDLAGLASQIHLETLRLGRGVPLPKRLKHLKLDLAPLATLRRLKTLTLALYKLKRLDALSGLTRLQSLDLEHTHGHLPVHGVPRHCWRRWLQLMVAS